MPGQLPEINPRNGDVDQIGNHEADVSNPLMPHAAISNDISPKLIAGGSDNMDEGDVDHSQQFRPVEGPRRVAHEKHEDGRDEFGHGEKQLMVPLEIKVIVPIIEITPPAVVMGINRG